MREAKVYAAWALILIAASLHLHAQELSRSADRETIPFELLARFLVVVRGRISDVDSKFILDTGTSNSVIDVKFAEKLRLQRRPGKLINFDRRFPMEWGDIADIQVGPLTAGPVPVMILRLAEYSEFGKNVDGIIGLDVLNRCKRLTIDYRRKTILFELSTDPMGDLLRSELFLIPVVVQGLPLRVIMDTGLQGMLLYTDRLRGGLPNLRVEGHPSKLTMGRIQGVQVKLPGVRIDGPEKAAIVWLIDADARDKPNGADGYLGPISLHARRLEFDFANKVVRWQ